MSTIEKDTPEAFQFSCPTYSKDDDYYQPISYASTKTICNIQTPEYIPDENPPAYHTMYPVNLNPFPRQQSLTASTLQSLNLVALNISNSSSTENAQSNHKSIKRKTKQGQRMIYKVNDRTNERNEGSENDNCRKIGCLERKSTLGGLTKSTEMIVKQALGVKEMASVTLHEFCETTTAHGFRHALEPNLHFVCRAFWFIITLGSLGLLIYMAYEVTYASFVIRRPTTEVNYLDNRTTGIIFPDITICSLSGFWKSKLEKYNISKSLASYITLSIRGPDMVSTVLMRDQRLALVRKDEFEAYMKQTNLTLTELAKALSPTCEEVIAACYSETLVPYYQCCKELLHTVVTPLGVCYTTLGKNDRKFNQTLSGRIGGVRFIFSVKLHEYMAHDANVISAAWLAEEGIHVSVSDYTLTPTVATNMQAIRIAPNSAASLALSLTTVDHSDVYHSAWPWEKKAPCLRKTNYWKLTEEEMSYTENNLYFTLLYRDCALEYTNCSLIPFRFTNDTTAECTPHQVRMQSILKDKIKSCAQEKLHGFDQDGKRLCFTTTINQQLSYTNLYKENLAALQETDQLAKGNLSMVNIYYTRLGYTELFERTPNFLTWFSDLGGQMGLFLGASFITLVELLFIVSHLIRIVIYWTVKMCYIYIKRFMSARKRTNRSYSTRT